jgi:hypothetical protein
MGTGEKAYVLEVVYKWIFKIRVICGLTHKVKRRRYKWKEKVTIGLSKDEKPEA